MEQAITSRFMYRIAIFILPLALAFAGCEEHVAVPKPRMYPRVIFPEKTYRAFEEGYCPFTFEAPAYARVERDTLFFEEAVKSDCWFNLGVKELNAKIYCSYYPVTSRK
ncbi:MAG: hypothetical protein ACR2K1_12285, partial [Saprospiraceae bacterium]